MTAWLLLVGGWLMRALHRKSQYADVTRLDALRRLGIR